MKCEFCGTEFNHQGKYNLHKYHCEKKYLKQQMKQQKQGNECEHDFRLLNSNSAAEVSAMSEGYKEVCEKCQTVQ